jgi:hypothetical protein
VAERVNIGPVVAWVGIGITLVGVITSQAVTQARLAASIESNAESIVKLEESQQRMVDLLANQAENRAQHDEIFRRLAAVEECCDDH